MSYRLFRNNRRRRNTYCIAVDGFNDTPVAESGLINLSLTLNGTSKLGSTERLPGGACLFNCRRTEQGLCARSVANFCGTVKMADLAS